MPVNFLAMDGTAANVNTPTGPLVTYTNGVSNGTTTFSDIVDSPVFIPAEAGYALVVTNGPQPGRYTVASVLLQSSTSTTLSFSLTHSSSAVTTTDTSTLVTGQQIVFTTDTPHTYTLTVVDATHITLSSVFLGPSGASTAWCPTQCVLDRLIPTATGLHFTIQPAQGLMPLNDQFGNPKWAQTDPLLLFSSCTTSGANPAYAKNLYVHIQRSQCPGWGAFHVPIVSVVPNAPANFAEGVNYMLLTAEGTNGNTNYVPYTAQGIGGGTTSFQTFSTVQIGSILPIVYNTALSHGGLYYAGMQQYVDTRGLGRQGLQLPPFYGISRLFSVYEAADYASNGSAYNSTSRAPTGGGATNLLRQNMGQNDGPVFWVEIDADGDSTFILNANAIDITRSPNVIATFAAGRYVIEANIFGFDRNFFSIGEEARLVLSASRATSQANTSGPRTNNIGTGTFGTINGPTLVVPGPLVSADAVLATYSRTPYMGDAWGSQTGYTDITQNIGPLQSSTAYQIASTNLNQQALTRPNQKLLEVVSSIGFVTTLGTGRTVGDFSFPSGYDFRDIGYEDPSAYPPTSPSQARPTTLAGDFIGDTMSIGVGTEYLGCTERLPMGALFRDADFRGEYFGGTVPAPIMTTEDTGSGQNGSLAVSSSYEQTEAFVSSVTLAPGMPGNAVVHVDGNQTNYSQLTNFRVNRGGSLFAASGQYPGGEVSSIVSSLQSQTGHTNVVVGRAFLVRNTVTDVGSSEVSAGDELMLLVVTSVVRLTNTDLARGHVNIGTNGSGEGYSAADLYRCEGHPLVNDNVRNDLNPSTVPLSLPAFGS